MKKSFGICTASSIHLLTAMLETHYPDDRPSVLERDKESKNVGTHESTRHINPKSLPFARTR
jgi:hypothetical protein